MYVYGIHIIDFIVLIVYLLGITAIGLWTSRKVKNMGDFIMPNKFGKAMMTMFAFGTGTHSDQAVSVAAKSYTNGLSGIWYQWQMLFITPFYWLIAPILRRFRALTLADVYEKRYNRSVAMLFAVFGTLNLMFNIGLMLKGSGAVLEGVTNHGISESTAIIVMTAMFVAYGIAGGLSAAIVTDFLQGILTIIFSFLLLPPIMSAVGGLSGLREQIANPQMFSMVAPAEIGVFYITILSINSICGTFGNPSTLGFGAAGRTEADGAVGYTAGNFIKRVCTVAWALTGLAAVGYFAGKSIDPDNIYGEAARVFLPQIMPGLIGIFIAAMLASVMSSCDAFMISSSALFTENIYRRIFRNKSAGHYLMTARVASGALVAGGLIFAYSMDSVVEGLVFIWKITPMMGLAFWMGFFWRRATPAGAWATTLGAVIMWWLTTKAFFIEAVQGLPFADALDLIFIKKGVATIYLPWQMIFYTAAGLGAGIITSLLTKAPGKEQLDDFYKLIRTPVVPGEPRPEKVCTLPEGIEACERRVFFPDSGFEIMKPSRSATIGFIVSWLAVFSLIGAVALIIY